MKTLYVTVGLPRSGKSTWAKEQNVPMVNPDSIRLAIHGQRFYKPAEGFVWATAEAMVRSLFLAGHDKVILDATNTTKARRDRWYSTEWFTQFVNFNASKAECIRRAGEDAVIVNVIEQMADNYQSLEVTENWMPPKPISP